MQIDEVKMEKEFNFNKFWGSSLIKPHVVFRRNSYMYCVYCGDKADSREHSPSKTFLQKPYPTDLPTVPACIKCNNGFSSDERYVSNFIKCLVEYYEGKNKRVFEIEDTDLSEVIEAKKAAELFVENPFFDDRLANILRKLAICHAAYEISAGYYSKDWQGQPERISYLIKPFVSQQDWQGLEFAEVINNDFLPEVGSRIFRNIYVVEAVMQNGSNKENVMLPMVMVDWTEIQNGFYRYQVYIRDGNIWVKMIIRDFLYAEVVFTQITNR